MIFDSKTHKLILDYYEKHATNGQCVKSEDVFRHLEKNGRINLTPGTFAVKISQAHKSGDFPGMAIKPGKNGGAFMDVLGLGTKPRSNSKPAPSAPIPPSMPIKKVSIDDMLGIVKTLKALQSAGIPFEATVGFRAFAEVG